MSQISDVLYGKLEEANVTEAQFREVCLRLLSRQIVYGHGAKKDSEIYNLAVRIEGYIAEYLEIMGFELVHDRDGHYLALFAPGAYGPDIEQPEESAEEEYKGLRRRLDQRTIKLFLLLRYLYDEALRAGTGLDEHLAATLSIEQINQTFRSIFREDAPSGTERDAIFRECRRLHLIEANAENWNDSDALIKVNRVITSMVFNRLIDSLVELAPEARSDDYSDDNMPELMTAEEE